MTRIAAEVFEMMGPVFWIGLALLATFAIVRLGRFADERGGAQAILDERLAHGASDVEESRSRLVLLTGR